MPKVFEVKKTAVTCKQHEYIDLSGKYLTRHSYKEKLRNETQIAYKSKHETCITLLVYSAPEAKATHCITSADLYSLGKLFDMVRSWDSSASIQSGYKLDERGSKPGRGKGFFL
jgi:hypothetical protein